MVTLVDTHELIPRTNAVLSDPRLIAAEQRLGRQIVLSAVRRAQEQARTGEIAPAAVTDTAAGSLPPTATTLTPVINATGVLLHTNLGRAPLSAAARAAVQAAAGCTDLEFDLAAGTRGRAAPACSPRWPGLPNAEAVHVVNNNAAALVLAATALAAGREIVVSRGELVEIGGGCRLTKLLESPASRMREVGTTNRTRPRITRRHRAGDRLRLKVHPSNYRIEGFTPAPASGSWPGWACRWSATSARGCSRRSAARPTSPMRRLAFTPARRW